MHGFVSAGAKVFAGTRAGNSADTEMISYVRMGTLPDLNDLTSVLGETDTVVHCAGLAHIKAGEDEELLDRFREVNVNGTVKLLRQAAASGVRRFIFISSIGVNGEQTHGVPFRPGDMPAPQAAYAISKFEAEQEILALSSKLNIEVVIIRPPIIVGAPPVGNIKTIANWISKGFPIPFGQLTENRRSYVKLDTLFSLVKTCAYHPSAPGNIFLVSEQNPVSTCGLVEQVADLVDLRARMLPLPILFLRAILLAMGKTKLLNQLTGDLEVDCSLTEKVLGWTASRNPKEN